MKGRNSVDGIAIGLVLVWLAIYLGRALAGHYALATNAFDLSVFDYAIWSLEHGGRGTVPFLGYSIFSLHFMPILALIAPFHAVAGSPVFLLILQPLVVAAAALMFFAFERRIGVERFMALALLLVFLFSRRTHSAAVAFFYPEVFQVVLTFAVVAGWRARSLAYWSAAVLLLMTKEDAGIYLAAFALVTLVTPYRNTRRAIATVAVAACWFVLAFTVAIPASRAAEGLQPANPLLESRFGSPEASVDTSLVATRLATSSTVTRVVNLLGSAGGLSLLGPSWLLPAVPGIVINLAADPASMQSAVIDHYVWPVLPWLFMAAAAGTTRLSGAARWAVRSAVVLLVLVTVVDSPALRGVVGRRPDADADRVLAQLTGLEGRVVLAQPNLIPHLPRQDDMFAAYGGDVLPGSPPDLVLLTEVGNLWPVTARDVATDVGRWANDPAYERVRSGPLSAFVRRAQASDR